MVLSLRSIVTVEGAREPYDLQTNSQIKDMMCVCVGGGGGGGGGGMLTCGTTQRPLSALSNGTRCVQIP